MLVLFAVTMAASAADAPTGGVGAKLRMHDEAGLPQVVFALVGSPADRGGITAGDLITAVDGQSVEGLPLADTVARIRGPVGSTITLSVDHDGRVSDVAVRREDTTAIATVTARIEADVCPAITQILRARASFQPLRGESLGAGTGAFAADWYSSTVQVPGAAWTRIQSGLGESLHVSYGSSSSREAAIAKMDGLVRELRPCFPLTWFAREPGDAGTVLFGAEHDSGWGAAYGSFHLAEGDEVRWSVSEGPSGTIYLVAPGNERATELTTVLQRVLQTANDKFSAVRGARREEGGPFFASVTYDARVPLPGASQCRVTENLSEVGYQCIWPVTGESAVVATFEKLTGELFNAVGRDWVYWYDDDVGYAGRYAMHLARRTSRAYGKIPTITVRMTEKGVTIYVYVGAVL